MTGDLQQLADWAQIETALFANVFFRVGAFFAVLPLFGEQGISMRVRLAAALALSVLVATSIGSSAAPNSELAIPALFIETGIGLFLGLTLRLMINGLQIAGAIAAQSTSLSQIFGTAAVDPQPAVGHILLVAGFALLVTLGYHVKLTGFLLYSYDIMPFGQLPNPADVAEFGTAQVAGAFRLGFTIAIPFLIATSVYNIAMGAINKAMPQLMVSFVGAPAITAAGLIILALATPYMLSIWLRAVAQFLDHPLGI